MSSVICCIFFGPRSFAGGLSGIAMINQKNSEPYGPCRGKALSLLWLSTLLLLAQPGTGAGQPFDKPGDLDPSIPTPSSVLGYNLGERFTPHTALTRYLEILSGASDRVLMETYGETYERRSLHVLTISNPVNLARQIELKTMYGRMADPRKLNLKEASYIAKELPIAIWLSFNIHGDEASGSEAAMAIAYRLAAERSEEMKQLLESSVILLDPCLNPDGRDRYVSWLRGVTGKRPDPSPFAREHHQPWPGGRFNHYLFDLNRDWAWLRQKETRARAQTYLSWRPQVHVDFHEMCAENTYFFFPPQQPVHELLPSSFTKWARIFGRENALAFDRKGWRYYTEESFDLFYPGYGDSWPAFQGAIGMTYEQAGSGFGGTALKRSGGDTLTLGDRAEHHYQSAMSTIQTAVKNRSALLLDFYKFFLPGDSGAPAAYLIPPGSDSAQTAQLIDLLMAQKIEVYQAMEGLRRQDMENLVDGSVRRSLPAGTYVIPMDQPHHRLVQAILEPEPNLPDTSFYDISAWSLPLAFGVDAFVCTSNIEDPLTLLETPPKPKGQVIQSGGKYAYLISWKSNLAAKAAIQLQSRGVKVHFASREFELDSVRYPPGSLVIFRSMNPSYLDEAIDVVSREVGVYVRGINSGLTDSGPDLGSPKIRLLKRPKVAVFADYPASPTSVGACWFLLDQIYEIPHSLLGLSELTESALLQYSVLIFPDDGAWGTHYMGKVDSSSINAIKTWVSSGGIFIGLGGGAFFASADKSGISSIREAPKPDDELSSEKAETTALGQKMETTAKREHRKKREVLPGTILRIRMDPIHPLGFGYESEASVLKISDKALSLGPPGTNVAWFTASPKIAGYATKKSAEHLANKPFLIDEQKSRGHVVLYVADPNFRLFWGGLTKTFLNGLFFLSEN